MPHFRGGLLCWRGGQLPPSRRWSRSPPSWHQKVCGVHPGSAAHVQEDFFFPKEDEIGLVLREHGSCSFSSFPCSFHLGVGNLCCTGVGKSICPQTVDRNKCFFFVFQKTGLSGLSGKAEFLTGQREAVTYSDLTGVGGAAGGEFHPYSVPYFIFSNSLKKRGPFVSLFYGN